MICKTFVFKVQAQVHSNNHNGRSVWGLNQPRTVPSIPCRFKGSEVHRAPYTSIVLSPYPMN